MKVKKCRFNGGVFCDSLKLPSNNNQREITFDKVKITGNKLFLLLSDFSHTTKRTISLKQLEVNLFFQNFYLTKGDLQH